MNKWLVGTIVFVVLVAIVIVVAIRLREDTMTSTPSALRDAPSLISSEYLDSLDKASNSSIDTTHLADSLTPPTNKWYSGMVLNSEPKPGFNVPNSILPASRGFELGLPKISADEKGVYGPHVNGIQLIAKDATAYKLTRYDELSITLTYYDDSNNELFDVTFASGSPYGFVTAKRDVEVELISDEVQNESNGLTTFKNDHAWYGAKTSSGKTGSLIQLNKGDELTLFSAAKKADISTLAKLASNRIVAGEVTHKVVDNQVKTTLQYETASGEPTTTVHLPHHGNSNTSPALVYPSLYGDLAAYKSSKIQYTTPQHQLRWSLELSDVSQDEKDILITQLRADIANSKLDKADTYFGGKQLQRLAQLVMVAESLGDTKQRDAALKKLTPALVAWFDSDEAKSFYYDETAKTIVGREASFGSDKELNDHHFHYGYFIYAASVVAKFDKDFLSEYKDKVNMLVADIANYKQEKALPLHRIFDSYAGHSWASGLANYTDGNNQESSSEAVNAWTGVGLWAEITDNSTLKNEAQWLLSNEIATANAYWLSQPDDASYFSPLVAINWGGKREYSTFFSDEANAKLAIQLLPLTPTMQPYIDRLPASIFDNTDTAKQYGDYIFMAQGGSFADARSYDNALIDDGNSKTYMMAYTLTKLRRE